MNTTLRHRTVLGGSVALMAFAAAATVFLGVAPAAQAANCPPPPKVVQPFLQWGDLTGYVPMTAGSFDGAAPTARVAGGKYLSWALADGAAAVADQEPWNVGGEGLGALSLHAGSSATSACTTAPLIAAVVRFFVKNTGSPDGLLHVELLVNNGKNGILDGGYVTATDSWQPTSVLAIPWPHPLKGAVDLRVRLTPVGEGASFLVDDVYIDPSKSI